MRNTTAKVVLKRMLCSVMMVSMVLLSYTNNTVIIEGKSIETNSRKTKRYSQTYGEKIAQNQVQMVINNVSEIGQWSKKTTIKKKSDIYNPQEELCAYAFELEKNGEAAGYVIVGANDKYPPIIEYAMEGRFLDDSMSLEDDEYIIYDGSVNYYKAKKGERVAKNIHSDEDVDVVVLEEADEGREVSFSNEWEVMQECVNGGNMEISMESEQINGTGICTLMVEKQTSQGSGNIMMKSSADSEAGAWYSSGETPKQILLPGEKEKNYVSASHCEVPCYAYVNYLDMYLRPDDPKQKYMHYCVPMAATNLLMYWHERKYYNLMYGGSWKASFEKLHSIMGGNSKSKNLSDVPSALNTYLGLFGIKNANIRYMNIWDFLEDEDCLSEMIDEATKENESVYETLARYPSNAVYKAVDEMWEYMKEEIREGAPFLYTPFGHPYYSNNSAEDTVNHQLLALGYQEFIYNDIQVATDRKYSAYLRVEDSWSNTPDRFVNLTSSSDYIYNDFMTLYFIGK